MKAIGEGMPGLLVGRCANLEVVLCRDERVFETETEGPGHGRYDSRLRGPSL